MIATGVVTVTVSGAAHCIVVLTATGTAVVDCAQLRVGTEYVIVAAPRHEFEMPDMPVIERPAPRLEWRWRVFARGRAPAVGRRSGFHRSPRHVPEFP